MNRLYINKAYDTSADTLLLLGAADLFRNVLWLLEKPHLGIVLRHEGDSQTITLPCSLRREELHSEKRITMPDPLITPKQAEKQAKKGRILHNDFDYEGQRNKQKALAILMKDVVPANLRTPEARLRHEPELEKALAQGPRPELAHYMAINVMKVADTFNEIVLRWSDLKTDQQWQAVALLYDLFSERANDLPLAIQRWNKLAKEEQIPGKAMVTAVQVINPATGKGANQPKGYRLSNGGLDSFWLLELLKFQGFMLGAAPYVMRGSKDRKTYVVVPQVVELGTLNSIMRDFRAICWSSTAIKQDILAALRLTQVLVAHRRTEIETRQEDDEFDDQPLVSTVQSLDVTSYKDMGSAHATMNVATINIPTWFPRLPTLQAVDEAGLLLQEHIRIIRRIEGYQGKENSEEVALLQTYRDFLSGHDLRSFWLFAARYGGYLFRQRDHEKDVKRWLPQLTLKGMEYLVLQHQTSQPNNLRAITQQKGFQNIASAIREATVRTQRRRSQENDTTYEVRYGLEQELMRKARRRDDFLIALNQFLVSYNVETAREEEKVARRLQRRLTGDDYKKHRLRLPVSTRDISEIEALLDTYPTELIASMLLAHGYARYEALSPQEIQNDTPDTLDEVIQENDTEESSDEDAE